MNVERHNNILTKVLTYAPPAQLFITPLREGLLFLYLTRSFTTQGAVEALQHVGLLQVKNHHQYIQRKCKNETDLGS